MSRWLLLLLVPVTSACTMPAATVSTVSGSYTGKYGGATEDFELRADGTYTQTLHADKDYANAGKWRIERARSGYDFIKFASFAKALDLTGKNWSCLLRGITARLRECGSPERIRRASSLTSTPATSSTNGSERANARRSCGWAGRRSTLKPLFSIEQTAPERGVHSDLGANVALGVGEGPVWSEARRSNRRRSPKSRAVGPSPKTGTVGPNGTRRSRTWIAPIGSASTSSRREGVTDYEVAVLLVFIERVPDVALTASGAASFASWAMDCATVSSGAAFALAARSARS
jgi:hypothetical protein